MVDVIGHNHQKAEELAEENGCERRVDVRHSRFIWDTQGGNTSSWLHQQMDGAVRRGETHPRL